MAALKKLSYFYKDLNLLMLKLYMPKCVLLLKRPLTFLFSQRREYLKI